MSTRPIVPRSDGEGGIGTAIKRWLNGYFVNLFASGGSISNVEVTVGSGVTLDITNSILVGAVTTSAGIEDAGKVVVLNEEGKVDLSMIPDGVVADISTITVSSGAVDAGKVPALDEEGKLDISFIPDITVSGGSDISTITSSSGPSDAGKIPALDSSGKLDISFIPDIDLPTGSGTSAVSNSANITTSENLVAGNFVNIYDDSGIKCRKAFAYSIDGEAYGYVLSSFSSSTQATVYFDGINTQASGLSIGKQFLSVNNPGYCTTTIASGSGNIIQELGFAISTTAIDFKPQKPIKLA